MTADGPLYLLLPVALLLLCGMWLSRRWTPESAGRNVSIDGLRGYLAFGVFLHHSGIWYHYLRTGGWGAQGSNLSTHLGQTSVALFFMITAYLFFGRLVRVGVKPIHWPSLYLGRVMRLTPLYVVAMLVMVLLVLAASQWQLKQSPTAWIVPMLQWLTFTVTGMPDLNGLERTKLIIAGVTWSLKFEWVFYASLLLLAPISKGFRSGTVTALALLLILALCQPLSPNGDVAKFLSFVPGMLAAVWAPRLVPITRAHPVAASLLALACLGVEVACFPTAYGLPQTLLLGVSFLIVASGNTLFGLLAWRVSLALGDLAYSIYLLHGLLLYTCLGLVLRPFGAADLSPLQHWAAIAALTPVLIVLCQLTHRYIEQPGIQATPRLAARLWPRPNLN